MANRRGKQRKAGQPESDVLKAIPRACRDETAAVEFLEKQRWGDTPCCPHCGSVGVYPMKDRASGGRSKRFLWRCRDCGKQFTVRVGTVFEDSRIPLRHWCFAFWAACASKKGVSALQISRQCSLSYKSALFMMHRIRWAMQDDSAANMTGVVEADETYIGGKPRRDGRHHQRGRGTPKQPVALVVQRGGKARARVVPDVTAKSLRAAIKEHVAPTARMNTDEWPSYHWLGGWPGGHDVVRHSAGEYSRGDAHTNTAESFFALLKRGVHGTFHNVSKRHLFRYLAEFEFRWDTRKMDDGQRLALAIRAAEGKRLTYREPLAAR